MVWCTLPYKNIKARVLGITLLYSNEENDQWLLLIAWKGKLFLSIIVEHLFSFDSLQFEKWSRVIKVCDAW